MFTLITSLLTYLDVIEINTLTTLFQIIQSFHYLMFDPVET